MRPVTAQPELPGMPAKPRRKRRVLLHVLDAGHAPDGTDVAMWHCGQCGYESGWEPAPTIERPACPDCNDAPTCQHVRGKVDQRGNARCADCGKLLDLAEVQR